MTVELGQISLMAALLTALVLGVDLTIADGECFFIIGASGVGKTTLAEAMLLLLHREQRVVHRLHGSEALILGGPVLPAEWTGKCRQEIAAHGLGGLPVSPRPGPPRRAGGRRFSHRVAARAGAGLGHGSGAGRGRRARQRPNDAAWLIPARLRC